MIAWAAKNGQGPRGVVNVPHGYVFRKEHIQCRKDPLLDLIGCFGGFRVRRRHTREALFLSTGYAFQDGETKPCRLRFWEAVPSVFSGRPDRLRTMGPLDANCHGGQDVPFPRETVRVGTGGAVPENTQAADFRNFMQLTWLFALNTLTSKEGGSCEVDGGPTSSGEGSEAGTRPG